MTPIENQSESLRLRSVGLTAMAAIMLAGLTCQSGAQSRAEPFPNRPVTIVVPFPAGGTADLTGRIIGQALARKWNQTVVIENKAGAGGNAGAESVARAEPNGYTLLVTPQSALVVNQYLYQNMRFDPLKFEPVALIVKLSNALVAGRQSTANTVADVIKAAKAAPDTLTIANQGNGSSSHLTAELFQMAAGVKLRQVPYRGSAPALTDLVSGTVEMMFDNLGSSLPLVESDKLKLIAVASPGRLTRLPNVPTVAESLPGFQSETWNSMVAPPGTPSDILEKVNADVNEVLRQPEVAGAYAKATAEVTGGSRADMAAHIKQESERWSSVIKSAGIKLQ